MLFTVTSEMLPQLEGSVLSDALEMGRIVLFPRCPVELPSEPELAFLRAESAQALKLKNISFYPAADRLAGVDAEHPAAARLKELLAAHSARVAAFLTQAMPDFVKGWRVGTSSFRPIQERGRDLKPHASNERIHVDAGAYGATHGDRILRFFINLNPSEDRVWASKGTFAELYAQHGAAAGIGPRPRSLREGPLDKLRTRLMEAAVQRGLSMARVLDSSPYDRVMRKFHNYMKDDRAFLESKDNYRQFAFKPYSAWMVLTDAVSHACLSGQFALVDTFLVPLANCRLREHTPFYVLQGEGRAAS